mmetsp:Transcript_135751/g.234944  ORF Transcript_135751/g.234944 Transcript_135751/m.234944 type:complete len:236 (+) Transcript_135751:114-821(+)
MAKVLGHAKKSHGVVITLALAIVFIGAVDTSQAQQEPEGTIPKPVLDSLNPTKISLKRSADSMGTSDPCCVQDLPCCPSDPRPAMQQIITKLKLKMQRSKAVSDLADERATYDAERAQLAEAQVSAANRSLEVAKQQLAAINGMMTQATAQTWRKYQAVLEKGNEALNKVRSQAAELVNAAEMEKFKSDSRNVAEVAAIKRKIARAKGQPPEHCWPKMLRPCYCGRNCTGNSTQR